MKYKFDKESEEMIQAIMKECKDVPEWTYYGISYVMDDDGYIYINPTKEEEEAAGEEKTFVYEDIEYTPEYLDELAQEADVKNYTTWKDCGEDFKKWDMYNDISALIDIAVEKTETDPERMREIALALIEKIEKQI